MQGPYPVIPVVLREHVETICQHLDESTNPDHVKLAKELTNTNQNTCIRDYDTYLDKLQTARDTLIGPRGRFGNYAAYEDRISRGEVLTGPDLDNYAHGQSIHKAYQTILNDVVQTQNLTEEERHAQKIQYEAQDTVELSGDLKRPSQFSGKLQAGDKFSLPLIHRQPKPDGEDGLQHSDKRLSKGEKKALIAGGLLTAGIVPLLYAAYQGIRSSNKEETLNMLAHGDKMGKEAMRANYSVGENSVTLLQYREIKSKRPGQSSILRSQALDRLVDMAIAKGLESPLTIPRFDPMKFKIEGKYQDQMWALIQKATKAGFTFEDDITNNLTQAQTAKLKELQDEYKAKKGGPDMEAALAKNGLGPLAVKKGEIEERGVVIERRSGPPVLGGGG